MKGKASSFNMQALLTRLSQAWMGLFTLAAFFAHVFEWSGSQLLAYPENAFVAPFEKAALVLGTDQLGRDVLAYLFYSCRTAWLLAFPPLLLASLFGVTLGTVVALVGSKGIRIPVGKFAALLLIAGVGLYFWPAVKWHVFLKFSGALASPMLLFSGYVLVLAAGYVLLRPVTILLFGRNFSFRLDVDGALQWVITVWTTFPKLLLLLLLTTFTPFSIVTLMGWICATYWVLPARVARTSVMQIKQETFFEASITLGLPFRRILFYHLWSFMKGPILTNFCFAASGLLGIGTTLAYLGIGLPADVPSWGKMLALSRYSLEAWWLLLFPALFLLVSIFSLQRIGHSYSSSISNSHVTK